MSTAFERYQVIARRRDNYCYLIVGALQAHVEMLRKDDSPKSVAYSLGQLEKHLAEYAAIGRELQAADLAIDAERAKEDAETQPTLINNLVALVANAEKHS